MAKELFAKAYKKVIPFEQTGEFFHKKARKYIENNNYINALSYYRKAVEKEPENIEYLLDLAEVFTEMGYFTESNQILFSIIQKNPSRADCYFGIGCNFLGMQDYDKAEECLEKYLDIEEDGVYADEAQDLLDVLQNQEFYFDKLDDVDPSKERYFKIAAKGKDFLDKGDYRKAVKELEKVVKREPGLVFARNNLALAYFCIGRLDKAIDTSYNIIKEYPQNIHANCNIALFLSENGEKEESDRILNSILSQSIDDPEELHKIAVTLCELKQHERVNQILKTLLRFKPYDTKVLHYMAISCFNLKMFKTALKYWTKIEKINPDNTISGYYKRYVQEFINDIRSFKELPYHFQVPYEEIISRVKKINDLLKLSNKDLLNKWRKGDTLRSLLSWGLDLNDPVIKHAILNVVASFNDKKSEKFLRDFILRKNEGEEQVKEALTLLKQMGADEPYIAYVDDNIVEVNVSIVERRKKEQFRCLSNISNLTLESMALRYPKGFEEDIKSIWEQFMSIWLSESLPKVNKPEGWAAALELYYAYSREIPVVKADICAEYNISYTTLTNNYKVIEQLMSTEQDGST